MSYGVLVRSLGSSGSSGSGSETKKEVKVFIGNTDITMKPEGEHVIVKVNGSPIEVPRSERHTIKGSEGHIVAKVIKSKDNVVILKSAKVSVLFDGKRVKLEGSNLLKNKLCGLCGDNNNNKIADVPSPGKCLMSKPKPELASYRVSLPSKPCSPLPSHLKEELERESERCIKFSSKPILECGSSCHPAGVREKRVSFTCMSKSDRRTQHIADKIRRGEVLPELKSLPESFSTDM